MASTRNKNTSSDYALEQKVNVDARDNNLYLHSSAGRPITECIPSIGYTPSHNFRCIPDPLNHENVYYEQVQNFESSKLISKILDFEC